MAPLVTLQFDPVAESARELIPEGSYKAQIVETDATRVSQAGNPKITVKMTIIDDAQYSGRFIFDDLTLTPKAAWKLVQFMEGIRVPAGQNFDPADWIGKTMWVDVVQDTFEGRTNNKVKRYRAGN